jgi:flagellar biosynthesis anti-sigma factor FlgM
MKISVVTAKYQSVLELNLKHCGTKGDHLQERTPAFPENEVSVQLSGSSQRLELAKQMLDPSKGIRTSIVQPISEAIESGRYQIDAEKIAEKMIGTIIDSFA